MTEEAFFAVFTQAGPKSGGPTRELHRDNGWLLFRDNMGVVRALVNGPAGNCVITFFSGSVDLPRFFGLSAPRGYYALIDASYKETAARLGLNLSIPPYLPTVCDELSHGVFVVDVPDPDSFRDVYLSQWWKGRPT